ncbi:three-Cys-motif partner protein TcmP [Candidatus Parcubacteria bacterium]|nr:three-Cys-motif partner protein TcmP [Candidatus Parcubacteria bacterium]
MKDRILGWYLIPYLTKVSKLKKMVVVVDGFAGKGLYKDGSEGSPIIICKTIEKLRNKGVKAVAILVESNRECFNELKKNIKKYEDSKIAFPEFGSFNDLVPTIIEETEGLPVFFYIDPFGIKSLEFEKLERIFEKVKRYSTEVLINFNYKAFRRVAEVCPELTKKVMNGIWYREILKNKSLSDNQKEEMILEKYKDLYRKYFNFLGSCPVMYKDEQNAKYHLIFATSHFDGLRLMNNKMGDVYRDFYNKGRLFDAIPPGKRRDLKLLERDILDLIKEFGTINKEHIKKIIMPKLFMRYKESDYNKLISKLIKEEKIYSETGRSRINGLELISLTKFPKESEK